MSARLPRLAAILLASTLTVAVSPQASAAPAAVADPPGAALDWIESELAAEGSYLTVSFDDGMGGVSTFPDYGLTIDAILALTAAGRGAEAATADAAAFVEDNVGSYISGADFGYPSERYAGPIAKAMLMAAAHGEATGAFGGFDLDAELRGLLTESGADVGRFSDAPDPTNTFGGDFSNGFGQALAVMALARTADGVPESALDFLLDQQCPGGAFRGDYTTTGGCASDASATVDATAFALQALVTVAPTCAVRRSVTDAVTALVAGQNDSGAFGGESGSNTNSTGLAAVALRSLGETGAADAAAAFVAGLQLDAGDDAGAVALNTGAFASAGDGVQVLERDGFRRATTQGVFAFGLPSYGEIGAPAIDPADFTPCGDPPAPAGTVSAPSVVVGGSLTVTGTGFAPGELVDVTLHSTPIDLGTVTADAAGTALLTFTVPADLEPGEHSVELVGRTSGVIVSVAFEALAAPTAQRALPATGRTTGAQAAAGAGLVALGGALLALERRRRAALI
ncbi:MAG: prenyltransferase/squalene oxidase repeat-containing protein [Acidimicrobiales bacterium]